MFDDFPQKHNVSLLLMLLSLVSILLSAVGFLTGNDVWLNSNSWLLVSVVLGIWGTYLHHKS
ncbi:MAG TPA: hypothetical protein VIK81_04440 [Patescibacteria group bacterium]